MLLLPVELEFLLAMPEFRTLTDVSGTLMFRTKRKRMKAFTAIPGFASVTVSELQTMKTTVFWVVAL